MEFTYGLTKIDLEEWSSLKSAGDLSGHFYGIGIGIFLFGSTSDYLTSVGISFSSTSSSSTSDIKLSLSLTWADFLIYPFSFF